MCSNTDRRCDGRLWVTTHLDTPTDLLKRVGQSLGTTDWMKITQQQVDLFADTTGDHQGIHTDRARGQRSLQGHHRARLSDPVAGAGGHRASDGHP
jgi:acyl dehydratase